MYVPITYSKYVIKNSFMKKLQKTTFHAKHSQKALDRNTSSLRLVLQMERLMFRPGLPSPFHQFIP